MAAPVPPTLIDLAELFLLEIGKSRTPNTVRAYRGDIYQFLSSPFASSQPLELQSYMAAHPKWSRATARCKHSRLTAFLRYVLGQREASFQVSFNTQNTRCFRTRQVLSSAEVDLILVRIPILQLQDALLYRLMYRVCLRVGEATRLRAEDVKSFGNGNYVLYLQPSTRTRRTSEVLVKDQDVVDRLSQFLLGRTAEALLFQAAKVPGKLPLSQQSVHKRWKRYCAQAGVVCSLEDLRASGIARLIEEGYSAQALRNELGYWQLHTAREHLKRAALRVPALPRS